MLLVPLPRCVMSRPLPLPSGTALLALEDQVRRSGSGLVAERLCGCWRLVQVWPKGSTTPSALSGALLRALGARLQIQMAPPQVASALQLRNAVRLGALELCFHGAGRLQGRRPLLVFGFERLELRLGGVLLLSRSLPPAASRRDPFFALIGRGEDWLAARGRAGGLALWQVQP